MSAQVVVIATDLRRATIKVSPNTYMTDVLQEACKKLGLPSDKYLLKHKQKNVDLSIVWRVSGLSPGAKLELVQKSKTASAVSVALQLPPPEANAVPNGRLIEKFSSDIAIWKILRHFESGAVKNLNITARGVAQTTNGGASGSGQMYYEMPVLNIMNRELATLEDFQKTLSQLGYNSGNVLIRLSFRKTDQTLFEAMQQSNQFFAEVDAEEKTSQAPTASAEKTSQSDAAEPAAQSSANAESKAPQTAGASDSQATAQEVPVRTDSATDPMDVDRPGSTDPLQPVNVFRAPSGTTPAAALAEVSESDYEPTVAHAQLHQARLQQSSQNKRLLSDRELEARAKDEEARLAAVSSVGVRVRFPDNTSADWRFGPEDTGAIVYQAVRGVMAHNTQAFRLLVPGSKTVIKDEDSVKNRLIHDYKLTHNVLLNLVWDDSVPSDIRKKAFLNGSTAKQATDVQVQDIPTVADKDDDKKQTPAPQEQKSGKTGEGSSGNKLPKWLKLPGKK